MHNMIQDSTEIHNNNDVPSIDETLLFKKKFSFFINLHHQIFDFICCKTSMYVFVHTCYDVYDKETKMLSGNSPQ